jgi:hypothetical protein
VFYELYADRHVLHGGLWFDPDESEFIRVTDMDSAAGEKGVTLLERGYAHITEERLREAAENTELFYVEPPPSPPKGRKHWFPRPWAPPPKPGYLFWTPNIPRGPHVISAWATWTKLNEEEGGKFDELPEEVQKDVLLGAQTVNEYAGVDAMESVYVIDKNQRRPGSVSQKWEKTKEGAWPSAIYESNPERAVWKILGKWGVRRDE